jgi:protein-S-isoprenylcysteine O-methyltransferase Ste14
MIWFLLSFLIWAFVHSLTAGPAMKKALRKWLGDRLYHGLYRLFYNVISVVTFVPVLYILWFVVPQETLWSIPYPWRYLTMGLQVGALIGLAISLLQTDVWTFLGLRQAFLLLKGSADPTVPVPFVSTGTYRLVRHPLYFFSLVFIWLNPVMGLGSFLFDVLATIYFWIGSIYEERRLLAAYGEAYKEYQQKVPRLLPTGLHIRELI